MSPSSHKSQAHFFVLAVLILLINLYFITVFPIVWGDEVMFVEPAANLADSGRFVSLAWPLQTDNSIWVGNAPLHSFLLAGWLYIFDLSILSARSFGVFEFFCAILFFTFAHDNVSILEKRSSKIIFLVIVTFAYGTAFNYRSGRYDPTGILLIAISAYFFIRPRVGRYDFLRFLPFLLIVASGLHVAIYSSICLAAVYAWGNSTWRRECLKAFGALMMGGVIFAIYLTGIGQFSLFIESSRYLRSIPGGAVPKDPSLPLLLIATFAVLFGSKLLPGDRLEIADKILLTILLVTPIVFLVLGRYPTYYTWMMIFPSALLIAKRIPSYFAALCAHREKLAGVAISIVVAAACVVGLPLQIASGIALAENRDYGKVRQLIASIENFGGAVIVDPAAWYAIKDQSPRVYLTTFDKDRNLMSTAERQDVRFAVTSRSEFNRWKGYLGGQWAEEGSYKRSPKNDFFWFKKGFGDKLSESYDLVVFRRLGAATGSTSQPVGSKLLMEQKVIE